jgi:hypothetical protein
MHEKKQSTSMLMEAEAEDGKTKKEHLNFNEQNEF